MILKVWTLIALITASAGSVSCGEERTVIRSTGGKVIITDITGKEWDITHAVENYGMEAENWNYGIGPFAITPINLPGMYLPGDPGYPDASSTQRVLGTTAGGEARAYPISALASHEVVNDEVDGLPYAVIY